MPATIGGVPHAEPNDSVSSWQGTSRALAAWIDENTVRRGDIINDAPPADPHTHAIAEVQGLSTRLGAIDSRLGSVAVGVTFVNNSAPSVPTRTEVIPAGWTKVGSGTSPITFEGAGFKTTVPGLYLIALTGSYGNGTVSGNYEYRLLHNGARALAFYGAADVSSRSGSCALQLTAGDLVQVQYYQSSGLTFDLRTSSFNAITFARIA